MFRANRSGLRPPRFVRNIRGRLLSAWSPVQQIKLDTGKNHTSERDVVVGNALVEPCVLSRRGSRLWFLRAARHRNRLLRIFSGRVGATLLATEQDQLFSHHQWAQTGKDPSSVFRGLAQAAGVDLTAYDACMQAGRYAQRIEYSRQEGDSLRVDGTPTFFANGTKLAFRRLPGSDDFKAIADSIIAHAPTPKPRH